MSGKFEIYVSEKNQKHYFRLKAGNGQTILGSQGYASKAGCKNGVESVKKNCSDEKCVEKLTSSNGKHYFNLRVANGQIIATSQMYADASGRDNGIASVQKNAPDADVVEVE